MPTRRDKAIAATLADWFAGAARDLPWRRAGRIRDPYQTLVCEAMAQQTQVSRVAERFSTFLQRFPTVHDLAVADEGDVLALWSGLGYYRRARHLHAAAKMIVSDYGGRVPRDVDALMTLPGVGRYTAGAIASLAYDEPAPVVDGNVARVLMRLEGRQGRVDDAAVRAWVWERAGALARAAESPGTLNEALMEMGAVVCTPKAPVCDGCPLTRRCIARREGMQRRIPSPRPAPARRDLYCAAAVVTDERGRLLVERRPTTGMWGGLWQAPTIERDDRAPTRTQVAAHVGAAAAHRVDSFIHQTTHRVVRFDVWRCDAPAVGGAPPTRRRWMSRKGIEGLGLSRPQRRILLADADDAKALF